MKYQISCIGKSNNRDEQKLIDKYLKRMGHKLKIKEVNFKNKHSNIDIDKEGKTLMGIFPKNSILFLLDKEGVSYSTSSLAKLIKEYEMNNIKLINFAIGGPLGHGKTIKKEANKIISFGKMTWSHFLARIMIVEQLYRIETIFRKHPYHK